MGVAALWYAAVFAVVIAALQIIFKMVIVDSPSTHISGAALTSAGATLMTVYGLSTGTYMLVMGIVCPPVYFSHYISAGVTRTRFAVGIFAAGAALSLCFAVLRIPLLVLYGELSLPAVFLPALSGALSFVVGWTASVGFQYLRFIPILVSTVCGPALFVGIMSLEKLQLPPWSHMSIFACALLTVGAVLLRVVKRIPVRC
jgi:hypothetical protein